MSDEVFSTILAYTKSPKVTKRTTFQDELIKAITARSARQRSSEYSDDFDSDEIVSLGDFSDTSVDENSNKKKMNDFHISDDDENNSPKLSFMKTKKSNSDIMKDEPVFSTKNDEEMAPDGCGNMVGTPLSESQNNDQEIEKDKIRMKPKPRILPVKSMSSENNSSPEANNHIKPSPRPRSMLKKHSHGEEKDGLGEGESPALREELEARSAPSPLPKLNNRQLEAEKKLASENLDPKDPWLTSLSSSSLKENLGDSFSPESGGKASVEDQNEELTENHNSLKSNENEENSFLIDFVTTPIEKSQESQVITDDLEEEKEKAELIMNDLTVDPLCKSQSILISTDTTESSKKTIEDRNMKNKKSTNNRVSSASGRLMTPEFLKKSSSVRRPPSTTTSPHYLGTLKVLDQKPSQKQNIEPERADSIRAAVYQEWLEKKNVYLHEMHRIKRIESENLRIQNEQKRAAKREEALASFEAWKAMKEKEAKKIAAQRRLEEKNKKKTEEENAARKGEALQAFERWKEKKMEYLREKNKKEREYERAKKQKEEETIAEKRKDNLTAVEKWNERKDAFFKEKEKEKINEKRREDLKRAEKKDKDKQAIDEYEKWLEKKERQERIERKQKKRHSFLENEALPPWSPPSRTVFSKKTIEDRNMKNKKSTNNRVSSASGRLMTPEFLKKSSSVRRPPSTTTSPHYLGTLKVLDQKPSQKQNIEPERADSIRAAVYQEWLEKKNVYLHEMHRIKTIESENLRIQNEQKRAAKREEALASFEAWKAMKEKEAKKIAAQRRLEEKNKKKTEEENAARKGEALQAFEQWKEKKMEYLREKNKKEREYERAKKQKEEETIAEKRKDNLTAVEKWNERKDAFFKENEKVKINEKRRELKRAEKKDKDKQALDEYGKCLEKKERQERIERKQKKRHSFLENEALPPWSPPSRTVFSSVLIILIFTLLSYLSIHHVVTIYSISYS